MQKLACSYVSLETDSFSGVVSDVKTSRRSQSLLFRLTVPSLLAVFLLWVGYTVYWSEKYETDLRNTFVENGERAAELFSGAVAAALWEYDKRSAEATLVGLTEWPDFSFGAILDQTGEFAVVQDTDHQIPKVWTQIDFADEEGPVRVDGFAFFVSPVIHPAHGEIGQLIAAFDERPLEDGVWAARRNSLVSGAIGFVLLGLFLTQIARTVTRPLSRITDAVEEVAGGDPNYRVPNVGTIDEVVRLASALNIFRENAGRLVEVRSEAEANRRVAQLAMIDDLTKLANRRAMVERFREIDEVGPRGDRVSYSIAHIDLDGFKQINDSIGHNAGDLVIMQVAERLLRHAEKCELIARIGGDEFVLIIPHSPKENTAHIITKDVVRDLKCPIALGEQEVRIGASVGVACHEWGTNMSETLINADIALYRAKAEGKGRFATFTNTLRREVVERKRAADEISLSIEDESFVPFFQGIFEAGSHRLVALETLARWDHPQKGILTPDHFLKIATDLNLMSLIDRQVFGRALKTIGALKAQGIEPPALSVNVSTARLSETDFADMLEKARVKNISVEVELLETNYLDEPSPQLLWQLDRIRELGVGVNIDDFGTGHASVAGLLQIKPDKVKIDRQFILPMLESARAQKLVETLLGICSLLDIDVVAEGVETLEHAGRLHQLGCRYLQGFALMKPVSAEELSEALRQRKRTAGP